MYPIFDLHTVTIISAVAAAGGIIGLDRTAFGQFMLSQPVVVGPLAAWLLGDVTTGIIIGVVFELIWVLDMPVGTFVPADATIGTVSATTIAVLGSEGKAPLDLVGFSMLLSTGLVPITMMADAVVRKRNSRLADAAVATPDQDPGCRLARAHLSGLVAFFLKSFVLYLFFIPAGLAAVAVFLHMPQQIHVAMTLFVKLLPLLGAALVLRKLSISVADRFLIMGFGAAMVLTLLLHEHPVVIILFIISAGFAGARYSEWRSWSSERS